MQICIEVRAYEIKAEMGGGFRGVANSKSADLNFRTDVFADQQDAFLAIFDKAVQPLIDAGERVGVGHYRSDRFRKNYFLTRDVFVKPLVTVAGGVGC